MDTYKWKDIDYLPDKDDWIKSAKNNETTAINALYAKEEEEEEEVYPAYISKHNSKCKNQVLLLII